MYQVNSDKVICRFGLSYDKIMVGAPHLKRSLESLGQKSKKFGTCVSVHSNVDSEIPP